MLMKFRIESGEIKPEARRGRSPESYFPAISGALFGCDARSSIAQLYGFQVPDRSRINN